MKYIFSILLCLALQTGFSQIYKTVGISYTSGTPTYIPAKAGSWLALDTVTWNYYTYNGSTWILDGYRVQSISGCSAPAYTPTKYQSRLVINACTALQGGPELYYYTGSAWLQINEGQTYTAGTGISITGTEIANTGDLSSTNELQTLSISGSDLSLSNGGGTVSLPGSSVSIDNYQLPATYIKVPATGLSANESVLNYGFASVNAEKYKFGTTAYGSTSTEYGGWLANGTSGDSIAVSAPFWVIIGDSQAEGHPGKHGRLHPSGSNSFSVNYQDEYGTLSYTLRQITKMRFFNHGIGSQTSTQVLARWQRDVLAQTFDPGDGRGARTLRRKPNGVIVIVGVNDIYTGTTPVATVTGNLESMARSARDNGIQCVFLNCPGDEIGSLAFYKKVDSLNTYFSSGALQSFGAAVVDYNSWWRDQAYDDNAHGQALLADDIHPSAVGYDSLAHYIFRSAKLPVLDSVTIYTELSPDGFSGFSRPTSITIQGAQYSISGSAATILFVTPLAWDSVWMKIVSSNNVTGTSYSGFSHILWHVKNDTSGLVTRREALYGGYQGSNTVLWGKSGSLIYPASSTDKVSIGTNTNTNASQLYIRSPLANGNFMINCQNSAGGNVLSVLDNNRVVINGTSLGGYNLSVNGSMYLQALNNSNQYNFFSGSTWEWYGGTPTWQMQSTNVNTGGAGYTNFTVTFDASEVLMKPRSTAAGADVNFRITNKARDWAFHVGLANKRIGIGTESPAASSVLDISSTAAGFLPPRMTQSQRDAIPSPAAGLTLYCTDCTATDTSTGVMQTYNGSTWKNNW